MDKSPTSNLMIFINPKKKIVEPLLEVKEPETLTLLIFINPKKRL
jgi:hypothetical protein